MRLPTKSLLAFLLVLGCAAAAQLYVGVTSRANTKGPQSALRELARALVVSRSLEIKPTDIRSPIGLTTLACRLWALDFFRGNCFGMIIYVVTPPDARFKAELSSALSAPCDSLRGLQSAPKLEQISVELDCKLEPSDRKKFRLVISFEKINRRHEIGYTLNEFIILDRLEIQGEL